MRCGHHELLSLEVNRADGTQLVHGQDYRIKKVKGNDAYFIDIFSAADKNLHLSAGFAPQGENIIPWTTELHDYKKLKKISALLNDVQAVPLSQRLNRLIQAAEKAKKPIPLSELASVFRESAFYSYLPELKEWSSKPPVKGLQKIMQKMPWAKPSGPNRFDKYRKFLDENGVICAQCDGTNSLFRDFTDEYFGPGHAISAKPGIGFVNQHGVLTANELHQRVDFWEGGRAVGMEDVTPPLMDPRMPPDLLTDPWQGRAEMAQATIKNQSMTEVFQPKPTEVKLYRAKYFAELDQNRASLLKVAQALNLRHLDASEPMIRAIRLGAWAEDWHEGRITVDELKQRLIKNLGLDSELASHHTVADLIANESRELRRLMAKYTQDLRASKARGVFHHYLDGSVFNETNRTLEKLEQMREVVFELNEPVKNAHPIRAHSSMTAPICGASGTLRLLHQMVGPVR